MSTRAMCTPQLTDEPQMPRDLESFYRRHHVRTEPSRAYDYDEGLTNAHASSYQRSRNRLAQLFPVGSSKGASVASLHDSEIFASNQWSEDKSPPVQAMPDVQSTAQAIMTQIQLHPFDPLPLNLNTHVMRVIAGAVDLAAENNRLRTRLQEIELQSVTAAKIPAEFHPSSPAPSHESSSGWTTPEEDLTPTNAICGSRVDSFAPGAHLDSPSKIERELSKRLKHMQGSEMDLEVGTPPIAKAAAPKAFARLTKNIMRAKMAMKKKQIDKIVAQPGGLEPIQSNLDSDAHSTAEDCAQHAGDRAALEILPDISDAHETGSTSSSESSDHQPDAIDNVAVKNLALAIAQRNGQDLEEVQLEVAEFALFKIRHCHHSSTSSNVERAQVGRVMPLREQTEHYASGGEQLSSPYLPSSEYHTMQQAVTGFSTSTGAHEAGKRTRPFSFYVGDDNVPLVESRNQTPLNDERYGTQYLQSAQASPEADTNHRSGPRANVYLPCAPSMRSRSS